MAKKIIHFIAFVFHLNSDDSKIAVDYFDFMRICLATTSQVNALFCVLNDCFEVFLKYVPLELLNKMAAVFECSLSDLIEEDSRYSHKKKGRKTSQLSEDEQILLLKYRELSIKEKNAILGLCDLLTDH